MITKYPNLRHKFHSLFDDLWEFLNDTYDINFAYEFLDSCLPAYGAPFNMNLFWKYRK